MRIHAAACVALTALTSIAASAAVRTATCLQAGGNRYRIEFTTTLPDEPVEIYASSHADGSDAKPVTKTTSSPVEVESGRPGERVYFQLRTADGSIREVSIRRLPLRGAINVRDLGGYPAADGETMRWGLLYRGSELGRLTPADLTYLEQLHLRVICDFRTEEERRRLPDRWPTTPVAEMLWSPVGATQDGNNASFSDMQKVLASHPDPVQMHQLMISTYRSLIIAGEPEYRRAIRRILDGQLPFLFHCTAGKDRTGLFSAILLSTLGISRETVTQDYLLSNQYLLDPAVVAQMQGMLHAAMPDAPPLSPEAAKVLLGVDKDYLDAAFDTINQRYGSFDNYRRNALGVSDADVAALRTALLTR